MRSNQQKDVSRGPGSHLSKPVNLGCENLKTDKIELEKCRIESREAELAINFLTEDETSFVLRSCVCMCLSICLRPEKNDQTSLISNHLTMNRRRGRGRLRPGAYTRAGLVVPPIKDEVLYFSISS